MNHATRSQIDEYVDYPREYDPSANVYREKNPVTTWTDSYNRMLSANFSGHQPYLQGGQYDGMREMDDDMDWMAGEVQERPPWWVPIIIIVGLVVIILIVVATAIYCGLRGTFGEPTTPKRRYDPGDDDAKSDQCSSVRLEIRSESRATCVSSRAGFASVGANDTTELQTLLVVPSNSQASIHPEPKRLDLNTLGAFEPHQKPATPTAPPPPSPVIKNMGSAADTQTEDDEEESTSCSL